MVWNDNVRALLLELIRSVFPVLVIFGIANFTDQEVATIMLMIGYLTSLLALIFKKGQQPGDPIIAAEGSETAPTETQLVEALGGDGGGPQRRTIPPPTLPADADDPR